MLPNNNSYYVYEILLNEVNVAELIHPPKLSVGWYLSDHYIV